VIRGATPLLTPCGCRLQFSLSSDMPLRGRQRLAEPTFAELPVSPEVAESDVAVR